VDDFSIVLDEAAVDAVEFTSNFEKTYGTVHPIFTGGRYSDASKVVKTNFQLMVVNIHAEYEENIDFCKTTLSNPGLAQFLAEHFTYWIGFIEKTRVTDFSLLFGLPIKFPFLAIVGYIEGSMSVLDVIQGLIGADELMVKLYTFIDTYQPILDKAKRIAQEAAVQRQLIEEQNLAYTKSLEEDREKERIKQEEKRQKEQEVAGRLAIIAKARANALERFAALPPEPSPENKPTTIAIKLTDGSRIQRKFSPDTPFQSVFDFIEGVVATRLGDTTFLDDGAPSLDNPDAKPWTIHKYELVSNFPRRTYTVRDASMSLKELDLVPQSMLFLQHVK